MLHKNERILIKIYIILLYQHWKLLQSYHKTIKKLSPTLQTPL